MTADIKFDRHWTVADYMAMDTTNGTRSFGGRDRLQKRNLYAEFGVEWFVIVDPVAQVVEVFQLNVDGEYVVRPGASGDDELVIGCFPELSIDLSKVWPSGR